MCRHNGRLHPRCDTADSVTTFFALLGAAGLWVLYELIGQLVGDVLRMVLGPVFRPIGRVAARLLSGRTVVLLWMGSIASYGLLPWSMDAPSPLMRALGLAAFVGVTPLALVATLALRHRRRARALRGLPA